MFRAGFVGLVGPTNSGKSTLINRLVGEKISIVSRLPQTTFHSIRGILNGPNFQVVFIDTPGYQGRHVRMSGLLTQSAERSAGGCDLLIWVFDGASPQVGVHLKGLQNRIKNKSKKSLCVLNKVDRVNDKGRLLPLIDHFWRTDLFEAVVPISAKTGDGVERLVAFAKNSLPQGVPLYPEEIRTDRNESFLLSEIVREKVYEVTRQEIPYTVWVEWEGSAPGKFPVYHASIHVNSPSRKAILIGKGGQMLKEIGQRSRHAMEKKLGHPLCLLLRVHLQRDWDQDMSVVSRYLEVS